jgi:Asp-tRNA(Asn)/Glu-tRNA(Gln) amidotransferase A subunit family amidase
MLRHEIDFRRETIAVRLNPTGVYDVHTFEALTYFDKLAAFEAGTTDPRAFLEQCLETIELREPSVKAFVHLNIEAARKAADESAARWRSGQAWSPIDGMPIGIKDLLETRDMPTEMGCEAMRGNFPRRDNAMVWALREAGAVILGKTVTAELGGSHPGATTNPFCPERTPGGSSSGSAAAVAARMLPAAIGTQVGGSIIRPAGFCGNVALKPSQGGLNRGERQATSMSTHGVHAGSIEDMWNVAIQVAMRAGGDRGSLGLRGPGSPPAAIRPSRLIFLQTEGWGDLDPATLSLTRQLCDALSDAGIDVIERHHDARVELLERAIADARRVAGDITAWENRWATRNLVDMNPDGVSQRAQKILRKAEAMTVADYHALLAARDVAHAAHASLVGVADAMITLACPGPAPLWLGDTPGEPLASRPTGDAVFNYGTSMLFAPVVSLPLLAVDGMPVGVQVIGQREQDAWVTSVARWLLDNVAPLAA